MLLRFVPLNALQVFIIGADKKVKLSILYPATTGRNFEYVMRGFDMVTRGTNRLAKAARVCVHVTCQVSCLVYGVYIHTVPIRSKVEFLLLPMTPPHQHIMLIMHSLWVLLQSPHSNQIQKFN